MLNKIKFFLKKYPFILKIHNIYKTLSSIFFINIIFKSIVNNKKILFDNIKKNSLLLNSNGKELHIVNSSDKGIGKEIYLKNFYDIDKLISVKKILKKNNIKKNFIIDIGANIGSLSIPAINRGFFKNCIAIEPDYKNYKLLEYNIALNALNKKFITHNLALGEYKDKILNFEISENNFGDHRIRLKNYQNKENLYNEKLRKITRIKSTNLDSLVKENIIKNSVVWMDCQGYEGYILAGSVLIKKNKVPLVIEFWPYGISLTNSFDILKNNIQSANYKKCYDINNNKHYNISNNTNVILEEIYNKLMPYNLYTDLLFL